jgi:RNA polymerase-interacting CarD/CdnL/TRCF family regulator
MSFQVGDCVVHPTCGVGRIVGLETKRFLSAEARLYYEVAIDKKSTVWVPVDGSTASGLRPLTPKAELARYRDVLRSHPILLAPDRRQRHLDLLNRMRVGLFQDVCEIVRDLSARGWHKALSEGDKAALKKAREGLCQEWAAADEVSILQATGEVDALLREGRQAHQV